MQITLPTKPEVVTEEGTKGVFKIENLAPGYGHTLGNSLRRVILSSIPGVGVTLVKIDGVDHEFSTIDGVKEDVITILLNLKRVVFQLEGADEVECKLTIKGDGNYSAKDIECPSEVTVVSKDAPIMHVSDKKASFNVIFTVKKDIGYVAKEDLFEGKLPVGTLVMDASFTPIRRATYEVENMRVGDRTDYNRILLSVETDGTLSPKEALDQSIEIMHSQVTALLGKEA